MKNNGFQKERRSHTILTVVFALIAVAYLYPILIVLVERRHQSGYICASSKEYIHGGSKLYQGYDFRKLPVLQIR